MTDPTAKVFISYKHTQKDLAVELDERLREHGVPVWRDERKTGADRLEGQIESVLSSDDISGVILLVSKEIINSPTILNVEMPCIHKRQNTSEEFFAFLLRCPGISVSQAQNILSDIHTVNDFSEWFFHTMQTSEEDSPNYSRIVSEVIQHRLNAIMQSEDDPSTIRCSINSYDQREPTGDSYFHADLSHHFEDGIPNEDTWNNRIRKTITGLTNQLGTIAGNKTIGFTGLAHLPIAFAIGSQFPTTRGIHVKWTQQDSNLNEIIWDITLNSEYTEITVNSQLKDSSKTDLAVLLSLTDDVKPDVGNTTRDLPDFNTVVEIERTGYHAHMSPEQGVKIANTFQKTIRDELNSRPNIKTIHLFQSSPAGLAFLLGQHTNTLPPIQTYEFDNTHKPRKYKPAMTIK